MRPFRLEGAVFVGTRVHLPKPAPTAARACAKVPRCTLRSAPLREGPCYTLYFSRPKPTTSETHLVDPGGRAGAPKEAPGIPGGLEATSGVSPEVGEETSEVSPEVGEVPAARAPALLSRFVDRTSLGHGVAQRGPLVKRTAVAQTRRHVDESARRRHKKMQVSKAFRAQLQLSDVHVRMLQTWAEHSFALTAVFRGSQGRSVILVALTDRARSAASFARTLRVVLKRFGVPCLRAIRGHWVTLISQEEALRMCMGDSDWRLPASAGNAPRHEKTVRDDDKLVPLPG